MNISLYFKIVYGRGYSWSIPILNIKKGDYVKWTWSAPGTINDIQYMVMQVASPTSETPSGFSSGTPSSKGIYLHEK